MDVTENETSTLRAEGRHPPLVFENHSQDTRYKGPIRVHLFKIINQLHLVQVMTKFCLSLPFMRYVPKTAIQ